LISVFLSAARPENPIADARRLSRQQNAVRVMRADPPTQAAARKGIAAVQRHVQATHSFAARLCRF